MENLLNTKKVTSQKSLSTDRTIVKMSRVTYGYIENGSLIITRHPSEMVLNSLKVFALKNQLTIKH